MDQNLVVKPFVSVILPVYNGSQYLREAITSILIQTYDNFELIIIDDGSTDISLKVAEEFNDRRIILIRNTKNEGLISSLNKGINISKGEFILRMDADDIAMPERIEKQVNFMIDNNEVVVCGTWFEAFGNLNKIIEYPSDHEELYLNLLLTCPIGHPTVIIRSDVLKRNNLYYEEDYRHSEDSNLWVRISDFGKLANIPEVLLKYRTHEDQITNKHYNDVNNSFNKTRNLLFKKICSQLIQEKPIIPFPDSAITIDHTFFLKEIIIRLIKQNRVSKDFNEKVFEKCISRFWLEIYNSTQHISFYSFIKVLFSPLIYHARMVNYYRLILLKKWIMQLASL